MTEGELPYRLDQEPTVAVSAVAFEQVRDVIALAVELSGATDRENTITDDVAAYSVDVRQDPEGPTILSISWWSGNWRRIITARDDYGPDRDQIGGEDITLGTHGLLVERGPLTTTTLEQEAAHIADLIGRGAFKAMHRPIRIL